MYWQLAASAWRGAQSESVRAAPHEIVVATPHAPFDLRARLPAAACTGSGSSSVCDLTKTLRAILDECNENPPADDNNRIGCVIDIAPGKYVLTDTIRLCRQHLIRGGGGSGRGARTRIQVAAGKTAFRVGSKSECAADNPRRDTRSGGTSSVVPGGGNHTEIRDLGLFSDGCIGACPSRYGIELHERAHLAGLYVHGFTQGIRILASIQSCREAPAGAPCESNANGWLVERTMIENSDHAAVYVAGNDTNAGLGVMVDANNNCLNPGEIRGEPCANIVDASFLGSTWVATHTAASAATADTFPGYQNQGASNRSVFVGPYAEVNQQKSVLAALAMALGGAGQWDSASAGLRLVGPEANSFSVTNDLDPNNVVRTQFGRVANSDGAFMKLSADMLTKPLRLRAELGAIAGAHPDCANALTTCTAASQKIGAADCKDCVEGWYAFDVTNSVGSRKFRIDAHAAGDTGLGTLLLREPIAITQGPSTSVVAEVCPSDPDNVCPP